MNLYEEMKLWESMWDDPARTYEDTETDKLVDEILSNYSEEDFTYEYDGFSEEYPEDHFNSWDGYWQTSKVYRYNDFEYEVDPEDLYERLTEVTRKELEDILKASEKNELMSTFEKLNREYFNASKEQETELINKLRLFVAENLEDLYLATYGYFWKEYEERAYEWASENLEPDWD